MTPILFSTKIEAMNYKAFPDVYWQKIEAGIKELKSKNQALYAAFDADGTLWDTDLGENFFNYQIDQKQVPLPANPFQHYLEMKNWGFRPGLSLYGYDPLKSHSSLELKPVMTLKSVVNNIRMVKKGESVSYGANWVAAKDSLVARMA